MVITIQSSQQITALTLNGNTGQSIVGTAVQISPNAPLSWVYRLTNTTWYPFAGEAGRASSVVTGTAVASTSGTSIDFTSIPSWVKRVTVIFNQVSTNGTSNLLIQIGSGSVTTSGYRSSASYITTTVNTSLATNGFILQSYNASNVLASGNITLCLISSNTWISSGIVSLYDANGNHISSGNSSALGGALDRVRITTVAGTDTFDNGSVNIFYE
jgi:hypothetical protein